MPASGRSNPCALLTILLLVGSAARASETVPAGVYEITTEIGMPHLEENIRYATVRERRCLNHQELALAFPILGHESLQGCALRDERRHADEVFYALTCEGGNQATGTAQWRLGADRLAGALDVKLGGKNMTFQQRVTARRLGECGADVK
jgi:hypothetical protein